MSTHPLRILAWGCLCAAACTNPSLQTSQDIRDACEDLVLDYAFYRDRLDAQAVAELFTEDTTLVVLGNTYRGSDAVFNRIAQTPKSERTSHLMSTIRIKIEDATRATGVSYVTVYSGKRDPDSPTTPTTTEGMAAVGAYYDEFVKTPQGWKIARREFKSEFVYGRAAN